MHCQNTPIFKHSTWLTMIHLTHHSNTKFIFNCVYVDFECRFISRFCLCKRSHVAVIDCKFDGSTLHCLRGDILTDKVG